MGNEATTLQTHILHNEQAPMRDGTLLRATIHHADEPRPVVLVRNPYGEAMTRSVPVTVFLRAGFAVVIQDCRGCGVSDGDFVPFENEEADTLDTIAWCAAAPWSDGRIVMYGASYSGMVQLAAATQSPPALQAIIPIVAPADYLDGVAYRGGAFQLGQLAGWHTLKGVQTMQRRAAGGENIAALAGELGAYSKNPLAALRTLPIDDVPFVSAALPTWRRWVAETERDHYWSGFSYRHHREGVSVPGLHIGGWFDLFLGGTLDNYTTLSASASTEVAREGQRLIIGPWSHTDQTGTVGELSFGAGGSALALGLEGIETAFLHAALNEQELPGPRVRVYTMGAGRWREADAWPIAGADNQRWYLHSGGVLATEAPAEDGGFSPWTYDADDPTPTVGGQTLMTGGVNGGTEWAPGPRDQRVLDNREDIVRFTSAPLDHDVEVTGPVSAKLVVTTSAADADVVVRLIDVWPDGRAMSVVSGITRLRRRFGFDSPEAAITPNEPVEVDVDLWATSQLFRAGHRIRVDICSASFPEFERNLGTPRPTVVPAPAAQRVFHQTSAASFLTLPVISP